MTKMFARQNSSTKTILLKSPDSNRVREVVITEIVVPSSRNSIEKLSFLNRMESKIMSKPSRKRRLDHLSQEEKIMRKKLKNREAAQTSRDRKKAKLEELESTVCLLQKQNEALCDEVQSLRMERDGLQRENAALSDELWRLRVGEAGASAEGPAVSRRPPLPQGVAPPPARSLPASPLLHPLHPHLTHQSRPFHPHYTCQPRPLHSHYSPFQNSRTMTLMLWLTATCLTTLTGSAPTKYAHLIWKSLRSLLIHFSNRQSLLRRLTKLSHLMLPTIPSPLACARERQKTSQIPWSATDRPPPAPFLIANLLQTTIS